MRILVLGIPYFAKRVANGLSEVNSKDTFLFLDTSNSIFHKILFLLLLPFFQSVYVIGGTLHPGGALKLAMLLNKKIFIHWVGTDVTTLSSYEVQQSSFLRACHHLCEVSWIQKELSLVGLTAHIRNIASFNLTTNSAPPLPPFFSVLSYMIPSKEKFYGIETLIAIAQAHPDVPVKIAGISKYSGTVPSNVSFLGWVPQMDEELKNCTIYLRVPEHDGLAFSVLEALAQGRYVGYNHPFPETFLISDPAQAIALIGTLKNLFRKGQLPVHEKGRALIASQYEKSLVMTNLKNELTKIEGPVSL